MKSAIVIAASGAGQWAWADKHGAAAGTLDAFTKWRAGKGSDSLLVLLLPGEDVLLTRVPMPTRNPAQIARALPFALEEHVLDDPANLHCVAGPWIDDATVSCAALARDPFASMLAELAEHDIFPDRACPDSLCVPWQKDTIRVFSAGDRGIVRWEEASAAAADAGAREFLVQGAQAETGQPDSAVEHEQLPGPEDLLILCATEALSCPVDLLQGPFLPRQRQAGWRSWRMPAALAAAAVLLLVVFEALQTRQLDSASNRMAESIQAQFRDAFPHIGRIQADSAPQIAVELQRLRQRAGQHENLFLDLLGRAAPALAASAGLRLTRLHYQDGELELGITGRQIADLDALRTRLQSAGLNAQQGAAQLDNDRVSGTITVRLARTGGQP